MAGPAKSPEIDMIDDIVAPPPEVKSLLEKYPHSERFRLKNGEKVYLPVHQRDFNFVVLQGRANLKSLNEILASEDLQAFDDSGYGLVQLYCIDYRSGDAGPYQETFEVFRIRQTGIEGRAAPEVPDNQYFVRRVSVSADKPLRFGIEVWGYPKKHGLTEYSEVGGDVTFGFSEREGEPVFGGCCKQGLGLGSRAVPENRFEFVTPYEFRRSHAGVINSGDFASRPYDESLGDRFAFDASTTIGRELMDIQFEATLWYVCRNMRAVGFPTAIPSLP